MKRLVFLFFLMLLPLLASDIVKLEIKGIISPATSQYLKEGMAYAAKKDTQIILLELDTPGGLSTSMREIIQEVTNSKTPVVVYVSPKGARAASAGTYLIYASHIAAMAPGTNIGAATPVNMMPSPKLSDSNISTSSTLEKKAINDAVAYIKSLAELNDRNITWAVSAVKDAKSISAKEALKLGVIEIIASDTKELLKELDGRMIKVSDKEIILSTHGAVIYNFEADWKIRLLSIITNPNIAYILLLAAIYGLFFEMMNPGAIFPGVVGVISGVMALYALNMIPFNYAGLLLMLLGIAFMISEVFIAGFGILGIGGVISFALGSLLLFDANTIGSGVSIPLIIAFTISSLAFFIFIIRLFISSRSAKVVSGIEEMLGSSAEVMELKEKDYIVHCHGENWSAISDNKLSVGQRVEVIELSGLVLKVKPIKE